MVDSPWDEEIHGHTAVYELRGKWYVGYVREVPGANTQGRTLKEARENLREALSLVLDTRKGSAKHDGKPTKVIREPILA
jgi:predicted RNase H-like HicB family nuclease